MKAKHVLQRLLPRNRWGDQLYAFLSFVVVHRRIPRAGSSLLNDLFYRLRISQDFYGAVRRMVSDKELAKEFVRRNAGDRYVVPTIAILHREEMIDSYAFPATCCIKPTHGSGDVILRRDHERLDRRVIKDWFGKDYYSETREGNYRGLRPKVIVEPILFDGAELLNYRLVCLEGEAHLVIVDGVIEGRSINHFLTPDWIEIVLDEAICDGHAPKRPANLDEMIAVARRLSAGFSLLRVDFYSDGHRLYVGEITNCHSGAMRRFRHRGDEVRVSMALIPHKA